MMAWLFHSLIAATLLGLMLSSATAQEAGADSADKGEAKEIQPSDEIIDEVMVLGVRQLAQLRADVIRAEDVVYDLYNDLNDDDRYDIICKKETRIGSQIPRRVCRSRLEREADSEAAEELLEGEAFSSARMSSAKHNTLLREKMAALANQHPELLAALKQRLALKKKFEREHAKKFD